MSGAADLLVSAVAGIVAGAITPFVLLWALRGKLLDWFATRHDLDGIGERANALETLVVQHRERMDEQRERLDRITAKQEHQWERIHHGFLEPLRGLVVDVREIRDEQIRQGETVRHMVERVDEIRRTQ